MLNEMNSDLYDNSIVVVVCLKPNLDLDRKKTDFFIDEIFNEGGDLITTELLSKILFTQFVA